jgi:drug/metabolite transporter (DMT)-like permease
MERLGGRAVVGAFVALAGSVLIFFQPGSIDFGWGSFALLGVAAVCFSESVVVSKLAGQHPVVTNFVGMSVGAVVLLVVAGLSGERLALPADEETQLAVAYLVAATVGLFLLALVVVQRWTASAASYAFVLMPVVAVILGALVADEAIAVTTIIGGAIVGAGVYVGATRRT